MRHKSLLQGSVIESSNAGASAANYFYLLQDKNKENVCKVTLRQKLLNNGNSRLNEICNFI